MTTDPWSFRFSQANSPGKTEFAWVRLRRNRGGRNRVRRGRSPDRGRHVGGSGNGMGQALHCAGVVLPEGEHRELYVVDGRITYEPVANARTVAQGYLVPGLVDAHCHIGLDTDGAVPPEVQERQALTDRDSGALLLRDAGSAADTRWIDDRDDLPRLIRAGR